VFCYRERLGPLTVGFHEPQFLAELGAENRDLAARGFWFQRSAREQRESDYPWGPLNPQSLNRYAYCLSNPLRYVDATGHDELLWEFQLTAETLAQFITLFGPFVADMGLFSVLFAALGTLAALGTPFGPFLVIPVADCAFEAYQGIYIQNYLQQLIDRSPTGSVTIRVYQSDLYGGTGFLIVGAGESTGIWITGLAALVFYDIFMNNAYGYDVHWQYQASWPGWFMWQYDMVMSLP